MIISPPPSPPYIDHKPAGASFGLRIWRWCRRYPWYITSILVFIGIAGWLHYMSAHKPPLLEVIELEEAAMANDASHTENTPDSQRSYTPILSSESPNYPPIPATPLPETNDQLLAKRLLAWMTLEGAVRK